MKRQFFYLFALLVIPTIFLLSTQDMSITGVVTSSQDKLPMPGVTVVLKGTSTGTQTDFDGSYSIKANPGQVLVFSFVGFKSVEVTVGKSLNYDVAMVEDTSELEEVVIQEYEVDDAAKAIQIRGVQSISENIQVLPHTNPNESYAEIQENGFKDALKIPLSTFAVDVDKAAYSNVRRQINHGGLPHKNAVRIEEMINYFNYDYNEPSSKLPFSINSELSACPWNKNNLLLHVGLKGKSIDMDNLPPSNIVFLLDVSGSMNSQNKLPLLKSSLKLLLETLRPEDRVAIVTYAGSSGLVLPSTSCKDKQTILKALNSLNAGGSTAGGAGLQLAYNVANKNFLKKGNNRIILATDGDFNVGIRDKDRMKTLIEEERKNGISISVLGFGMGNYKDDMMETIADNGNGNYAYIDNLLEAKKVLVNEFGGTFYTIAKDVKFQLEFNPVHVDQYRLIGYENRLLNDEDFDNDKVDAGDIGAGHTVTALYEIIPMADKKLEDKALKYQVPQLTEQALTSNDLITLKLRYKEPKDSKSRLIQRVVKNAPMAFNKTSDNYRFSAAIAEFGMLLRDSEFKGEASWNSAKFLAANAKGSDEEGYRAEMVRLIDAAKLLAMHQEH